MTRLTHEQTLCDRFLEEAEHNMTTLLCILNIADVLVFSRQL
jgi:hypothetical protein